MAKRVCVNLVFAILLLTIDNPAMCKIIYVKASATGANTGASWTNAYKDLQSALQAAHAGDEIWVAGGTYKPSQTNDTAKAFNMKRGVGLYGGFSGTETSRNQRIWNPKATLSGSLSQTTASYHVVIGASAAVLDGFTITGAASRDHCGGGMYNDNVTSLTIVRCEFIGNSAEQGGGMCNTSVSLQVIDCAFLNNSANTNGGGMCNTSSSLQVIDCTFLNNWANTNGGGIYNSNADVHLSGSNFKLNRASSNNPLYINNGGGLFMRDGSLAMNNCVFESNFANNTAGDSLGGGFANSGGHPVVTGCTFTANEAIGGSPWGEGGAMLADQAIITGCVFQGNNSVLGGAISDFGSTITNCVLYGNRAHHGGGIWVDGSEIRNCVISANTADYTGGGIVLHGSVSSCTNVTITRNTANVGGGFFGEAATTAFINCILWGNTRDEFGYIVQKQSSYITFYHCDIRGCGGSGLSWNKLAGNDGGGNIDADPRFLDALSPLGMDGLWMTCDDNLRPAANSPCVNAGMFAGASATDIAGTPRYGAPEIGAYEIEWPPKNATRLWMCYR